MVFNRFLVAFVLISATTHLHSCEFSTTSTSIRRVSFSDAKANSATEFEQTLNERPRTVSESDVSVMSAKEVHARAKSLQFMTLLKLQQEQDAQLPRFQLAEKIRDLSTKVIQPIMTRATSKFSMESARYQDFKDFSTILRKIRSDLEDRKQELDTAQVIDRAQTIESTLNDYKSKANRFDIVTSHKIFNALIELCQRVMNQC